MKIVSIAISRKKGTRKQCVDSAELIANHGLSADAHAGRWHRQVSFLAAESIEHARERGAPIYGTCAGVILLATLALGESARRSIPSGARGVYQEPDAFINQVFDNAPPKP